MRGVSANAGSVQKDYSQAQIPVPEKRTPSPGHSLRDVKLDAPYRGEEIPKRLEAHNICKTDDPTFDDCIFQSVLFTEFFDKVEKGEIRPGQWEKHDRPALYLLKKSVELLQPLGVKIESACRQYDEKLTNSQPELRTKLEKELKFVQGLNGAFKRIESDLLHALEHPGDFVPSRHKACFLLFAHAMLSDAANAVLSWMGNPAAGEARMTLELPSVEEGMVRTYVEKGEDMSNLFSPEPLTPADEKLCRKGLNYAVKLDDMEKSTVPSFSRTGSQGVLAILHCIFHGKGLLSGASDKPYSVHDNLHGQHHLPTLRHDCEHLQIMLRTKVLSSIAPKLRQIYLKLENPADGLSPQEVKRDLTVLFHMLHENTAVLVMLNFPDSKKSFLDCAKDFLNREFAVVDLVPLLNKLGFSIAPINRKSAAEEKSACYEAAAQAMDSLWKEFRGRHREDLASSGLFTRLPRFLAD